MNKKHLVRNKTFTVIILILGLLLAEVSLSSYSSAGDEPVDQESRKVRNIILLIGDGMGVSQVSAAITISGDNLNMTKTNHIGFMKTHSYDNYTTDSAASGTAMASGNKTRNGMIGMAPDSTEVKLITEMLREQKKMSYGVVSTSAITHATPASFVAHNVCRSDYEGIALDFVRKEPDVFIGGGKLHFMNRSDRRNLVRVLERKGYQVAFNIEDLKLTEGKKVAGLLADFHMPPFAEGRNYALADATKQAVELLSSNRNGFFLMVEGSQIDWGGHANNAEYVLGEVWDFDVAVGIALQYAERDKETLVIVTADHETGGMSIPDGNLEDRSVSPEFTSIGHTGVMVPVFAFGAGAEKFTGVYDNTGLFDRMAEVLKLRKE
ncbi:MAG: alkaline phosphatase [Bacteroidales bacterium]|nr:alkaline phosphatase [Bacteroidales bacterium]